MPSTGELLPAEVDSWETTSAPAWAQPLLDRARAAEAQNDVKTARAKANEAEAMIPDDPFYWYFSAALAIREGDGTRAKASIGKALTLAPSDPAQAHRYLRKGM